LVHDSGAGADGGTKPSGEKDLREGLAAAPQDGQDGQGPIGGRSIPNPSGGIPDFDAYVSNVIQLYIFFKTQKTKM
jgi:hypothetical protein